MSAPRRPFNWQPYRSAFAFTCGLVSAVAAVTILISSNNKPVEQWLSAKVRPTVLLAICTVVANISIHFLLSEGLPILWWLEARADAPGGHASYERLQNIYNQGMGAWAALLGLVTLRPNRAGLACMAAVLVALNGPFLQRASHVDTERYTTDLSIRARLAREPPRGFSGLKSGRLSMAQALQPGFAAVVKAFSAREDIVLGNDTGCVGTCTTEVEGMGLVVNCTTGEYEYNMQPQLNPSKPGSSSGSIIINYEGGIGFYSDISFERSSTLAMPIAAIRVSTKHKNKEAMKGTGIAQNCTLTPSTVRYPVTITNSTVVLTGNITSDRLIHHSNTTEDFTSSPGPTTFGGLVLSSQLRYNAGARIWFAGAVGNAMQTNGSLGFEFARLPPDAVSISTNTTWTDPMPTILAGLRELMFRAAIAEGARNASLPVQIAPARVTSARQIYRTDGRFLAIAVACVLAGLAGTAPLFWRMWRLGGEDASLDPAVVLVKARRGEVVVVGGQMGYDAVPLEEVKNMNVNVQPQGQYGGQQAPFIQQGGWVAQQPPPGGQYGFQHGQGRQGQPYQGGGGQGYGY
ncbi:hypothetical protein EDC01DRAFT_789401 [Geopyxis carbonaria]|nr:hypothetical protein EDC01DRAFT_789401 [Geopyxis carbonaria]